MLQVDIRSCRRHTKKESLTKRAVGWEGCLLVRELEKKESAGLKSAGLWSRAGINTRGRTGAGGAHDGGEASSAEAAADAGQHACPLAPPQPQAQLLELHLQPKPVTPV